MRNAIVLDGATDPAQSGSKMGTHRFLLRLALAGAHVFAWIFIFQYFYLVEHDLGRALARVALLFAFCETTVALVTPYAAGLLRSGAKRSIRWSLVVAAAGFVILGAAFEGFWGTAAAPSMLLFAFALGLHRSLYWVAYETAAPGLEKKRATPWSELLIMLAPAAAGIAIAANTSAPVWILYASAVLILCSAIPLSGMADVSEAFAWNYRETYHEMLTREHRALVVQAILEGMVGAALLLFWPIAIFLITGWSYGVLGVVLSLTLLIAFFVRAFIRALMQRVKLHDSWILTAILAVSPWLLRLMVATPLGVVLVDSYFYTTSPRRFGIDPFVFTQSADAGSYLDEYTALKEIALSVGRIAVCVIGAFAAILTSVPYAFIVVFLVAAIASSIAALRS